MPYNKLVSLPYYFCIFLSFKYILASESDQLADIPANDIGFDDTHPHFDSRNDFFFNSMAVSSSPSQYINVEPEEEGMYSGDGDMTIRAADDGTDILRVLKLYQ